MPTTSGSESFAPCSTRRVARARASLSPSCLTIQRWDQLRALLASVGFEEEARVPDFYRDGVALTLLRRRAASLGLFPLMLFFCRAQFIARCVRGPQRPSTGPGSQLA